MPHATAHARRIWVALLAIAFLSACAPSRPKSEKPELKNGQATSQAAAKATHDSDIDALVLSSSSMDEAQQADAGSVDVSEAHDEADAGSVDAIEADTAQADAAQDDATAENPAPDAGAPE